MDTIALAQQHGERLLQIHIAGLAALAALMLGLGQGDLLLPLGVSVAAAASIWLTDITGWFRLHRTAANLIALAVVLWVLKDLRQWVGITQVLFIAKLLVYLEVILLFQKKDARAYWQLAMVSLLQVVVAAAFQQGAVFGFLLLVYFVLALSAMILFFLYREWKDYDRPEGMPRWLRDVLESAQRVRQQKDRGRNRPSEPASSYPSRPSPTSFAQADNPSPSSQSAGAWEDSADSGFPSKNRWPLTGQSSILQGGAVAGPSGLGWILKDQITKIALATWVFTILLFFVVPRTGGGGWGGGILSVRQSVGFTDQVALGELGRILQKSDEVLRIRFYDEMGNLYYVDGPLYLRGVTLEHYENGQWRLTKHLLPRWVVPLRKYPLPSYRPLVVQEITIEPMDREELFCLWPFAATDPNSLLFADITYHRLLRPKELCGERFSYTLWTTALEHGSQAALNPARRPESPHVFLQLPNRQGETTLPSLEALTRQWVQESGIPKEDHLNLARMLETRLRTSTEFQYSLQGQSRNPALDPIEDFITEHRQGHCEYFASALALMLRSVGIPSRVVVGYLCDEWNAAGQVFQVRQWHAHMWVEAYLAPRYLPNALTQGPNRQVWSEGAWLRLDPTPLAEALQEQPLLPRLVRAIHRIWANYVLELDRLRQTEAIYKPILETVQALVDRVRDPSWWSGLASRLWEGIQEFFLEWRRSGWFSWRSFVVSFVVGGLLGGVVFLVQKLIRSFRQRTSPKDSLPSARRVVVEFYRRMEVLLRQQGLHRLPGQTPREFALTAGSVLVSQVHDDRLAEWPTRVVEAFYQVRFGNQDLDAPQTEEVEHTLAMLKNALLTATPSGRSGSFLQTWRKKIGSFLAPNS